MLFTLQKQGERSENELATDMYFNRAIYPDVSSVAGLMRTDNAHPPLYEGTTEGCPDSQDGLICVSKKKPLGQSGE